MLFRRQLPTTRSDSNPGPLVVKLAGVFLAFAMAASAQSQPPSQPHPPGAQSEPGQTEPSSPTSPQSETAPYHPITGRQRAYWAVQKTLGPNHLLTGLFAAGIGTARDAPREYRGTWLGFAKRYGIRESGISVSNVMEAGLGAL